MVSETLELRHYKDLPGPAGVVLAGNLFQIKFSAYHQTLEKWADEYGPLYRIALGPRKIAVISDPETIVYMHRERPDLFRRTRAVEAYTAEMGMKGVFSTEGDDWRRQRKLVAMALNTAHLKSFYPKMKIVVERLLKRWEAAAERGETIDLCRDLMRYTVDVTTQLAFGIDFNTLETDGPVIQQNLDKVFPVLNFRVNAPFPYWHYIKFKKDRELDRALADLKGQVNDIIADVHQRMATNRDLYENPSNFLEAIIAAQESEGMAFSDEDIFANVCTLLLAGEDTTANTIAWTVDYFLQYPEHYQRARDEVDGILGDDLVVQSLEQAAQFPFVEAVYSETMRLKPVAPLNAMEPNEDVELMGHLIPRGTVIMMLNRYIANQPSTFGEPAKFDPERWLADDKERGCPHDTSAFLPFGTGPRFCPGRNLALVQLRSVLAMLIRNFDVELADPAVEVAEKLAFTMMPTNLNVRMKKRAADA